MNALVVIDMQARLVPHIDDGERVTERVRTLVRAADLLDLPVSPPSRIRMGWARASTGFWARGLG